jgi:hypothetical protein
MISTVQDYDVVDNNANGFDNEERKCISRTWTSRTLLEIPGLVGYVIKYCTVKTERKNSYYWLTYASSKFMCFLVVLALVLVQ